MAGENEFAIYFPSGPHWLVGGPTPIKLAPPTWLASGSGLWQLAPGIKPRGSFLFSRFSPHLHPMARFLSALQPQPLGSPSPESWGLQPQV